MREGDGNAHNWPTYSGSKTAVSHALNWSGFSMSIFVSSGLHQRRRRRALPAERSVVSSSSSSFSARVTRLAALLRRIAAHCTSRNAVSLYLLLLL